MKPPLSAWEAAVFRVGGGRFLRGKRLLSAREAAAFPSFSKGGAGVVCKKDVIFRWVIICISIIYTNHPCPSFGKGGENGGSTAQQGCTGKNAKERRKERERAPKRVRKSAGKSAKKCREKRKKCRKERRKARQNCVKGAKRVPERARKNCGKLWRWRGNGVLHSERKL